MFIHWGLYSIPSRGEWVRSHERMGKEEYRKYYDEFDPDHFDAGKWASAAKNAGMRYAVMTAKHHDGFCMFDSKYTDYKSTNTKAKKDFIKEYADAFRKEGLKVGIYYSLLDWHHEDYPHYGDKLHPMRDNEEYKTHKSNIGNYLEYVRNQVKELLTNYGKIDILWFDFSYEGMWGEDWEGTKLVELIRSISPDTIINDRIMGDWNHDKFDCDNPPIYDGDFRSPEQIIPEKCLTDAKGRNVPWELCVTLNDNWGYCSGDKNYKTPQNIIRIIVECVSKGGNCLINVGPNARGDIPKESLQILDVLGDWMYQNSESIYGCGISEFEKPQWGRYTQRGNKLYAHIFERGTGEFVLFGIGNRVKSARLLSDGSEMVLKLPVESRKFKNDAFLQFPYAVLPDENDTVVKFELK